MSEARLAAKLALLEAVLQPDAHPQIPSLITALGPFSPVDQSPYLGGIWKLIYTNRPRFSPLESLPGCRQGRVFQGIDLVTQRVINLIEIFGPGEGCLIAAVQARFEPQSATRITVIFEETLITLPQLFQQPQTASWIEQIQNRTVPAVRLSAFGQQGWLETVYVDETLRVSEGNEGSLFILSRAN